MLVPTIWPPSNAARQWWAVSTGINLGRRSSFTRLLNASERARA
jgi:hypothetical protein